MRRFFVFLFFAIPVLALVYSYSLIASDKVVENPVAYSLGQPRVAVDPDVSDQMREVFEIAEETIGNANDSGKQFSDYAHISGWLGAVCSWLIIGVTVFLKNASSSAAEDKPKTNMPSKSVATAVLAVVAAVCPLASEKLATDSEQFIAKANSLRVQKSDARTAVFANEFSKAKLLEILDKLRDEARR